AVGGVSWRILVPDLAASWAALAAGRAAELGPRGTSYRRWGERLCAQAQSERRMAELGQWHRMLSEPSLALVDGALDAGRDVAGTARHVTLELSAAVNGGLVTEVTAACPGGAYEVLASAAVVAGGGAGAGAPGRAGGAC